MLILTRRLGESLIVGDKDATITVLGVKGNQVRIGIQADADYVIDREEIYLRKQQERQQVQQQPEITTKRGALQRFASSLSRHRPQ